MVSRARGQVSMRECAAWLAVIALVGVALLAWWLPAPRVGAAPASSADSIQIYEPISFQGKYGGPMGTQVTLALIPGGMTTQTQNYQLGVVTSPPSASSCASAIPIAGLGPVQVNASGGNVAGTGQSVTFLWPSQMGKGTFWFCATPLGGSGTPLMSPVAESLTIFTANRPQLVASQPSTLQAGGQISVTVTNWFTSDGQAPQLSLTQPATNNTGVNVPLTATDVSAPPGTGTDTIFSDLPANLAQGSYTVTATGECGPSPDGVGNTCAVTEVSPAFPVLAAPTPLPTTAVPTATSSAKPGSTGAGGHTGGSDSIGDVLPVLAAEGAAALILFAIFANLVMRRRRQARATTLTTWRSWERSPDESDHFRVEPLPKRPRQ